MRVTEVSVMSRAAQGAAVFQGPGAPASFALLVAHRGKGQSRSALHPLLPGRTSAAEGTL